MAATLEELTAKEIKQYRNLADNSRNIDFLLQSMFNNSHLVVSVARKIQDDSNTVEYDIEMLERTAHPQGYALIPKHLTMHEKDGLVTIITHGIDSYSVESSPVQVSSKRLSFGSLPDEFLFEYALPSAGLHQRITSFVFPPNKLQKNGKILRFIDETTQEPYRQEDSTKTVSAPDKGLFSRARNKISSLGSYLSSLGRKEQVSSPMKTAVAVEPTPSLDYASRIPEEYRSEGAFITLQRIREIFEWSAIRRSQFSGKHADIFSPFGKTKKVSPTDFVNAAESDGVLNDRNIDEMLPKILEATVLVEFSSPDPSKAPLPSEAREPFEYTIPEKYANTDVLMRRVRRSIGDISPYRWHQFGKSIENILSGSEQSRSGSFTGIVKAVDEHKLLTQEVYDRLLQQAEVAFSEANGTKPELSYESRVKNTDLVISQREFVRLIGKKSQYVKKQIYSKLPWFAEEDGKTTLGLAELFAHYRFLASYGTEEDLKGELDATLEGIVGFERKRLKETITTTHHRKVTSAPTSIGAAVGGLSPTETAVDEPAEPVPVYGPGHVYSYHAGKGSEFARQLNVGHIKIGDFIYNGMFDNVGTLEWLKLDADRPKIGVRFTGEKEIRELFVNQERLFVDWNQYATVPEGIDLPDGTRYSSKSAAGVVDEKVVQAVLEPTALLGLEQITPGATVAEAAQAVLYEKLGSPTERLYSFLEKGGYTKEQTGKIYGFREGQETSRELRIWERKGVLVPGEDGNYSPEDIITRLMQIGKEDIFREWGYEGETKGDVFRAVNADLEAITGGKKKQSVQRVEAAVKESKYEFCGEHGAAYEALVRRHLPGDDIALRLVAELTKEEIDWNRAGQELPKLFKVPDDKVFDTLELLAGKGIAIQTDTGYILNSSVLTPV